MLLNRKLETIRENLNTCNNFRSQKIMTAEVKVNDRNFKEAENVLLLTIVPVISVINIINVL